MTSTSSEVIRQTCPNLSLKLKLYAARQLADVRGDM
jgi:hypothetical protein